MIINKISWEENLLYNPYLNPNQTRPSIVYATRGDVTGDRIPDNVFLTGIKTADSPFTQNITLMIQDGATGAITTIPLESNAGYNPTIFLGDFTASGVKDILVGINSGGSGAIMYYYIYSALMNKPKLIFDYNVFNEKFKYEVKYMDNFKVRVLSKTRGVEFIIDISNRGKEYLDEIYDKDGKLKQPIEGFVNPLSGLYPIDFNSDGVYELFGFQRVAGRYNADALGYIQTTLQWYKTDFEVSNQYLAIFGKDVKKT